MGRHPGDGRGSGKWQRRILRTLHEAGEGLTIRQLHIRCAYTEGKSLRRNLAAMAQKGECHRVSQGVYTLPPEDCPTTQVAEETPEAQKTKPDTPGRLRSHAEPHRARIVELQARGCPIQDCVGLWDLAALPGTRTATLGARSPQGRAGPAEGVTHVHDAYPAVAQPPQGRVEFVPGAQAAVEGPAGSAHARPVTRSSLCCQSHAMPRHGTSEQWRGDSSWGSSPGQASCCWGCGCSGSLSGGKHAPPYLVYNE